MWHKTVTIWKLDFGSEYIFVYVKTCMKANLKPYLNSVLFLASIFVLHENLEKHFCILNLDCMF